LTAGNDGKAPLGDDGKEKARLRIDLRTDRVYKAKRPKATGQVISAAMIRRNGKRPVSVETTGSAV
jgi:hypothetical protein